MKTAVKRTISALLAVILLLGAAPLIGIDFNARATNRTKDEAINWVKSKVGQGLDMDGAYGCQCVDLILAYYDYLGVSRSSGNGGDYAWNTLPSGWQRLQGAQPQKGDILVYSGNNNNPYGHVAIYESDYSTYHQNFDNKSYVTQVTYVKYNGIDNPYWGVIRPNWSSAYANIGDDFYGIILNTDCWTPIESDAETGKVYLQKETGSSTQKWHFVRREGDNAYTIASCYDGKLLEMTDGIRTAGTQVQAHGSYWGGNYQKWYLIPYGNGYIIKSKHYADENWVMDLRSGSSSYGNIIEIWELNYRPNSQVWSIYTGDEVQLKAATLTASVKSSTATFTWNKVWGARYDLKIWKSGQTQGNPFKVLLNTASGCTVELPVGTYVCSVDSWDYFQRFTSNKVTITVSDATKPTASISATNNAAASQTATLSLSDNAGLAGYYWGTSSSYSSNTYATVSGTSQSVTKTVSAAGTYYLTAKDSSGNVSTTVSKTFYQTALNANGGSVSPASVITASGNSFLLPAPTRDGYTFKNWNTNSSGTGTLYSAGVSYKPTGNVTLYAQWQKNEATLQSISVKTNPTKTTYTVGETLNTAGLTLTATYSDKSTQTITSGFTCSPIKLDVAGFRTITVSYGGKTATFGVTVNNPASTQGKVKAVAVGDVSIYYKSSTTLKPTVTADEGVKYTVKYESSNPNTASVDENGRVYGNHRGAAIITCTVTDEFGNEVKGSCVVTVDYSVWQWIIIILLFGWIWYI